MLDSDRGGQSGRVWDGSPGFVQMQLGLERNQQHGLAKLNAADTTFGLDTLIVVLTATGADTITQRYAISGRPDTGVIDLAPMVFTLNPLLNWKARFYSIDTSISPMRRDTVHIDSVIFAVRPADTAVVEKVVSAAFSVVRARFRSTTQDSIGSAIRYIRLKVGGVTRDSVELYGPAYNAVWFADRRYGWLVQDSGRVQKTSDSGETWFPQNANTTVNLYAVSFPTTSVGYIAGDEGLIKKTTDGGLNWSTLVSRTDLRLNRLHFSSADVGYVVGDSGIALKTTDGGANWKPMSGGWFKSPNTSATISDIGYINPTTWFAVTEADSGAVRTTSNYGATWTTAATTNKPLRSVHFDTTSDRGYAVGDAGYILRYNGSGWAGQTVVQSSNLYGVFTRSNDSGWAVGDSDRVVRNTTNGGNAWAIVPSGGWTAQTATSNSWYGVAFDSTASAGYIVGAGGNIRRTTNKGANWNTVTVTGARTRPLRSVTALGTTVAIAVGDSGLAARTRNGTSWNWYTTGAGNVQLNGVVVHHSIAARAWMVGASNTIRGSSDTGRTFSSNKTQTGTWNAISIATSRVWVVGNGGAVRRSNNLNTNNNFASSVNNGAISANLYAVAFYPRSNDTGYVAGAGGVIYRTVNANNSDSNAVSWTSLTSPTAQDILGMRFINGTTGWIVGRNGTIWRTTDRGTTWIQQYHPNSTDSLRSVWSNNTDTAFMVGNNSVVKNTVTAGHLIGGKPTPTRLNAVHFRTRDVGYIVGANGAISKSTNAGLRWNPQSSTVSDTLNGVHFATVDSGWAVGNNGRILRTINGGTNWATQTHPAGSTNFRKVRFTNHLRGWVVGDNGTILRTTDAGATWTTQESGTTKNLLTLFPNNVDTLYVAGQDGTIRKTLNSGVLFIFYKNLNGIFARNDSLYIASDNGHAYRSRNGGNGWTLLTGTGVGTTKFNTTFSALSNVHFAGNGGKWFTITHTSADSVLTERNSNMTANINGVWGSSVAGNELATAFTLLAADSGKYGLVIAVGSGAGVSTLPDGQALRGLHCATGHPTCWMVGAREQVLRNVAPRDSNWRLMSMGAKRFDHTMFSKYLRPGIMDSVILQAIDRPSPLRGYEKRLGITVGAGQDTTINAGMTRCGYGGLTPPCRP